MNFRIAFLGGAAACLLVAQTQNYYAGSNATGKLVLVRSVNAAQAAQAQALRPFGNAGTATPERFPKTSFRRRSAPSLKPGFLRPQGALSMPTAAPALAINPAPGGFGFDGLTHAQQRLADNGNQYSVEPPNPGIAVGNGYVLQGVNNAVQVYNRSGTPLLAATLTSNRLFGVSPAIIWSIGVNGVFPTDMRVFYDGGVDRWFVLQRAQDYDVYGNPLPSSRLYLAVSQTGNPLGTYNIYTIDTTNPGGSWSCPCVSDYPQIGADQYGFYISSNEYNAYSDTFVDVSILAISKASLAAGAAAPGAALFIIPWSGSGYEFTIVPASTPPSASYFQGYGGGEYFVSSQAGFYQDSQLALWLMTNTSSLNTPNPALLMTRTFIPTMSYMAPDVATQRPGPLPYGWSLTPPGQLAPLDGNDARVLSLVYAGGRLYATLAAQVTDSKGRRLVGGMYAILSPTLRNGTLMALVLRQGTLGVEGNHLLRPAIAVNAQGRGAIAFTLVGPDYYPSAAYVAIDAFSTGSTVQLVRTGYLPEDGFTGYQYPYLARWGDHSTAVVGDDGAVWMTTEYIPNLPRTEAANWGTYIFKFVP